MRSKQVHTARNQEGNGCQEGTNVCALSTSYQVRSSSCCTRSYFCSRAPKITSGLRYGCITIQMSGLQLKYSSPFRTSIYVDTISTSPMLPCLLQVHQLPPNPHHIPQRQLYAHDTPYNSIFCVSSTWQRL